MLTVLCTDCKNVHFKGAITVDTTVTNSWFARPSVDFHRKGLSCVSDRTSRMAVLFNFVNWENKVRLMVRLYMIDYFWLIFFV